jgi:hypothetical protein
MDSTKEVEIPSDTEETIEETQNHDNLMYPGMEDGQLTVTYTAAEVAVLITLLEFTKDVALLMKKESLKDPKFNPQSLTSIIVNTDYFAGKIMDKAEIGLFDDTPTH